MKLKIRESGQERYLDVGFWSFAKCHILAALTIAGISSGIMFIIFAVVMLIIVLVTGHFPH